MRIVAVPVDRILRRGLAVAVGILIAGSASVGSTESDGATTPDSLPPLTLSAVVDTALKANAQLHTMQARYESMQYRSAQVRTLPNPMFQFGVMDMTSGGNWPNTSEKRFMLSQDFPWFGKRGLRGTVAANEADAMKQDYDAMVREVVMAAKETYYSLYSVQRTLAITRAEENLLEEMRSIAEAKYSVGEVTQQDVLQAQTEISMLQERQYELEQEEVVAKARLNLLLNRRADSPIGYAVTEPHGKLDRAADELFALAEKSRPEIKRAQLDIKSREAERALMKKEYFPDYRLGLEYRSFRWGTDMAMFTIGFDLPIWRGKYSSGVRESEKMIESSQAGLEAARQQTSYDVQDARFKLATARRTLELYKTSLIPQAEARLQASEAGYRTGKVSFLELLESERVLLNARIMAIMAEGNVGMEMARLERAVGTDLFPTTH